jgi:hypothetical protein
MCPQVQAQNTYTAASCSQSDVNAVINGPTHTAVNGDTIIIPAGNCTWTSGITISGKGIDITGTGTPNTGGGTFGAGTPHTTLVNHASAPYFTFTALTYGQTAKVELLTMDGTGAASGSMGATISFAGTCTSSGCPNIRVDNINYAADTWATGSATPLSDGGFIIIDDVFGVVDHNTVNENPNTTGPPLLEVNYSAWKGIGNYGDNSFATPDTFGTGQALYIENNSSTAIRLTDNDITPGGYGGARYVCRFNEIFNMNGSGVCSAHGTAWGGRFRGQRQVEAYYNNIQCTPSTACNLAFGLSSGTGYYFSNVFSNGTGFNFAMQLDIPRAEGQGQSPWNNCDGTQPWDQVPFTSTSQCLDQTGTGAGLLLQNNTLVLASAPGTPCTTPGQCWTQNALDPVYEAGDTGNFGTAVNTGTSRLTANKYYYAEVSKSAQTSPTSPFNGAIGTGYGNLANRPTTCTPYVGYWATDQGNWNTYSSSQQGELFACTATNTWTLRYTPYTYPHPLASGGTIGTNPPPNPPTNLTVSVQ